MSKMDAELYNYTYFTEISQIIMYTISSHFSECPYWKTSMRNIALWHALDIFLKY